MADDVVIHHEPEPAHTEGGAIVDSTIDHAEKIGEHAAKLDVLGSGQAALAGALDEVKRSVELAHDRIDNLASQPAAPAIDAADIADAVVDKVEEAAKDTVENGPAEVVEAPKEVANEATEDTEKGGNAVMKFFRKLNLH